MDDNQESGPISTPPTDMGNTNKFLPGTEPEKISLPYISGILARHYAFQLSIPQEQLETEFWNLCRQQRRIQAYIKKDFSGGYIGPNYFDGYE